MKRFLCLFFIYLLIISLTSCSSGGGNATEGNTPTPTPTPPEGITYSTGKLDTTGFNAGGTNPGMQTNDVDHTCGGGHSGEAHAVATQSDGKIVVVGAAQNCGHAQFVVARYNTDGTLDAGFGTGGIVNTQVNNGGEAWAVAIDSAQKIVVAGFSNNGSHSRFTIARYTSTGTLDATFGGAGGDTAGTVTTYIGINDAQVKAIAIQSNGMIVVAGWSYIAGPQQVFAIARYTAAGVLDGTFGTAGVFTHTFYTSNAIAYALAIQPADQKIVVAGYSEPALNYNMTIMRLTTTGGLDTATFGSGTGIVTTAAGSNDSQASSVALQSDGKIVVAGNATGVNTDFAVARYTTAGVLDNTFNPGGTLPGTVTTDFSTHIDSANAVAIQTADQKIVAAGYATIGANQDFALARYNTNGSLDTSFGTGGKVTTQVGTNSDNEAQAIVIQSDGKIVAAGFSFDGLYTNFEVMRYGL